MNDIGAVIQGLSKNAKDFYNGLTTVDPWPTTPVAGQEPVQRPMTQKEYINRPMSDQEMATILAFGPGTLAGPKGLLARGGAPGGVEQFINDVRYMAGKGMDTWRKLGAYIAPDRGFRWEIPDTNASLVSKNYKYNPEANYSHYGHLDEFLDHPELYKAYPELRSLNIATKAEPDLANQGAFWPPYKPHDRAPFLTAQARTPEDLRRVLLHEVQHAVQNQEGFQTGGSPERAPKYFPDAYQEERARLLQALEPSNSSSGWDSVGTITPDQVDQFVAYNTYLRIHGETEARAVENRLGLTNDQLRATPPLKSYDIDPSRTLFYPREYGPRP